MSNAFDDYQKTAANNGQNDQAGTADYSVVAGNGVSTSQAQLKSSAAKDLMFVRESVGGYQVGGVIVNGSGHDFGKDKVGSDPINTNNAVRKGRPIRVKRRQFGEWGTTEVDEDAALGRKIFLHGYGGQYGEWKEQYERIVNYNNKLWYVLNPVTGFYDDPPDASIPKTSDTITITGIDIPAEMRGFPMIIKFGFHGSVQLKKVTWIAQDNHRIELPGITGGYGLGGFGTVRGGIDATGLCSYVFLGSTFTNVIFSPHFYGATVNCPNDYGFINGWFTAGNTPLPSASPALDTFPTHDYTTHLGQRRYQHDWRVTDPDTGEDDLLPVNSRVLSNLLEDNIDYSNINPAFYVLDEAGYYGGQKYVFDDGLRDMLPAPPFSNPAGGYFNQVKLELQIEYQYDTNLVHHPGGRLERFFNPDFYNHGANSCISASNKSLYESIWANMDAGEGWRMGYGGWAKGAWIGGWLTNFDSASGPYQSQEFVYQKDPCEQVVGEGSHYQTFYTA